MAAPLAYDVTILVNDVDVTNKVPYESMSFDDYARQVSSFRLTVENPSGVTPAKGHSVVITADSLPDTPVIFNGVVMECTTKKRDNGITVIYELECADQKVRLQKSVLDYGLYTGADFDILGDLLTNTYPDLTDLFDFTSGVNGFADGLEFAVPDGTSLLDALNDFADMTGGNMGFENAPGAANNAVTFDSDNDLSYTLDTGAGMSSGGETASGNPDNAYQGTSGAAAANQHIQIKITLAAATDVEDIQFDYYADVTGGTGANSRIILRSGGSTIWNSNNVSNITNDAAWHTLQATVDFLSNPGNDWTAPPYNCDEIWILLDPGGGAYSASDVRLDNIIVNPPLASGEPITELQWNEEAPAADFNIDIQAGDEYAADLDFTIGDFGDFNSVTVIGSYEDVAFDWIYDNDGSRTHLDLEAPIKSLVVYKNTGTDTAITWGSALALGTWGNDTLTSSGGSKDVLHDTAHNWLLFDTAPPNLVNSWRITGTIQRPIRVRVENIAEGEDVYATTHTDETITSLDQAVAIGQAQLNQKNSIRRLSFTTNHPGLKPGQAISVTDSARGLDETLVIHSIRTKWIGTKLAQFDIECGDEEPASLDVMLANVDKRTRAGAIATPPDTQTAYLLTSDGVGITSNGQIIYSLG